MELLDYFRILKALIILFLLFVCMIYVPNQNGKTLAGFNLDDLKTTLRHLRFLKMTVPLLQVLQKSHPYSSVTLLHTIESRESTEGPYNIQVKLVIFQ